MACWGPSSHPLCLLRGSGFVPCAQCAIYADILIDCESCCNMCYVNTSMQSRSTSYICVYFIYGICHSHIFMYAFSNDHNAIPHYIIIPVAACTRQHPGPWVELQSAEARAAIAPLQRFMYATRDSSYFDSCVIMQSHTTSSSPLLHAHGNTLVPV